VAATYAVHSGSAAVHPADSFMSTSATPMMKVAVSNKYSEATGKHPGQGYGNRFFEYGALVEPHRPTKLRALFHDERLAETDSIKSAKWHITQLNNIQESGAQVEQHAVEDDEVTVTFKHPGSYHVKLEARSEMGLEVQHETFLTSLYVRRELRSLDQQDLDDLMDGMMVIYTTTTKDGQRQYGRDYRSSVHFAENHLNYAGDRECDHMHDGMGFITQHLALTSEFESALQAVNPALSVPYWDYTIDRAMVDNGEMDNVFQSEILGHKFFGSTNDTAMAPALLNSRWAYLTVPMNASAQTHNAYGYLRAPWNVNQSPYVTRSQTVCGVKAWDSWPSCQTHYDVTFSDAYGSWYNYVWAASYTPHGPVHTLIGGYKNCEVNLDALANYLDIDNSSKADMQYGAVTFVKGAWRSHLIDAPTCSSDTSQNDCLMVCQDDPTTNEEFRTRAMEYLAAQIGSWVKNIDKHKQGTFVDAVLCKTAYVSGDQLEAGSPSDPSFWPIHPTIDRLLQYKHIVNPFGNEDWGNPGRNASTSYCTTSGGSCDGHHEDDVVPFHVKAMVDGNFTSTFLTNGELYWVAHPNTYQLSYIYDTFSWDHCAAQGWEFTAAATDDASYTFTSPFAVNATYGDQPTSSSSGDDDDSSTDSSSCGKGCATSTASADDDSSAAETSASAPDPSGDAPSGPSIP